MKNKAFSSLDYVASPFVYSAALLLGLVRRAGMHNLPVCRKSLLSAGVFPIRRHYYEPLFDTEPLRNDISKQRELPGIDFNVTQQIEFLGALRYGAELVDLPLTTKDPLTFHYHNSRFGPGDAELLYSVIRQFRPTRIVEVGSGFSTLMAREALRKNAAIDASYSCEHLCIEPYEEPWLEQCGATIIRERVETVNKEVFRELRKDDILFIDSSHIIRPGGDVLCEYLQILPLLKPGVLVHIHDIFTPRDYPAQWICDEVRFWNEQYLLEAFLSNNGDFEVLSALNFLKHNHFHVVAESFPVLAKEHWREPGSFWIRRK